MFMRPSSVSLSWVVSLNLKAVIRSSKSNRMFVTCLQTWSCKHYFPLSFVSQLKGCDHWSGLPNRIECLAPVFKLVLVNIIFPFHLFFNLKGVIRYSKSNRTFVTCHQTCSCKLYFPLFLFWKEIYARNDLRRMIIVPYMPPTWRLTNVHERTKRTGRKYSCRNQADEEAHYQYIKEDLLDDSNTYISSLDKTVTISFRVMFFLAFFFWRICE